MKLTVKQKEIVRHLQQGEVLITTECAAYYSVGKISHRINLRTFWNLVKKEIIYQETEHFDYILTDLGKGIKL